MAEDRVSLSVVIPSRNAANLVPCMDALRKHEQVCSVVIVDDGLELSEVVGRPWGPSRLVKGEKPFIFSRNVNLGIVAAGSDDVILLNDDALLETPGGFTAMQRLSVEHPEYGIISATTNCTGNANQYRRPYRGLREDPRMVCFVAVLIPRRTLNLIGPLDERFVTYGFEDNDYCRRIRLAGLKIGIYDECFVDHLSLKSTFRGSATAPGDIAPGREIYRAKWGDLN